MPVPKGKEELYGKIVGKNINAGKSLSRAKRIADKAVASTRVGKKTSSKSTEG